MTFDEAMQYLHSLHAFGSKLDLNRIRHLLGRMRNPQDDLSVIHIAGTNGKGSVAAMLESVLRTAGYKVGLYTSPYLEYFGERMTFDGKPATREEIAALVEEVRPLVEETVNLLGESPTEFEAVTAMGFRFFARKQPDIVLLEVGLGGRFDATNVVERPALSVITNIGYDHMDRLGNTLGEIAFEKAGIIKPERPVVTAAASPEALAVIEERCCVLGSPLYRVGEEARVVYREARGLEGQEIGLRVMGRDYDGLVLSLLGEHQAVNAATALLSLNVLAAENPFFAAALEPGSLSEGLQKARWPGRLEVLSREPLIMIDGAHNPEGFAALSRALHEVIPKGARLTLLTGMLRDKDVRAMLREILPHVGRVVTVSPESPRALDAESLARTVLEIDPSRKVTPKADIPSGVQEALRLAKEEGGGLLVCGSLYLIGKARSLLKAPPV